MGAGAIVDPHPTQRCQPGSRAIPLSGACDHLDIALAAAVPGDVEPLPPLGLRHHRSGRGQLPPLLPGPAFTLLSGLGLRGRLVQGGVAVEVADVGQPVGVAGGQPGQIMGGVVAVGHTDECRCGNQRNSTLSSCRSNSGGVL